MADESGDGAGDHHDQDWPSVDGSIGALPEKALGQARLFFFAGFFLLPWLWFLNCFYFWPVLRSRDHRGIRPYVIWSGIGCVVYSAILLSWAMAYSVGGEAMIGKTMWKKLSLISIVDKYQLDFM